MPWPNTTTLLARPQSLILAILAVCLTIPLLFFRSSLFPRSEHPETWRIPTRTHQDGVYTWDTVSQFHPVRFDNVANMSTAELCVGFPTHLLDDIQPVLKTGHGVLAERMAVQLQGVSACLSNLLIFSDLDQTFQGHEIIDVIADIPTHLRKSKDNDQLKQYRRLHEFAASGSLEDVAIAAREGWKTDKFKFLPAISRAWRMRPERRWYVFYEDDTYVVWDNLFRALSNFDPDVAMYFGSPSPGHKIDGKSTWFGYGGAGYVISREAMRRLVRNDWDPETGEYAGPKLMENHWDDILKDCCGDSVLGWMLWEENVTLSGLFPMFNPLAPHVVPFSDRYYCQPVFTMHKAKDQDMTGLWRWEWERREVHRPLLYRDLAVGYWNLNNITVEREDWDNGWRKRDSFGAPFPSEFYSQDPHLSSATCAAGCEALPKCIQWTYHLRKCNFVRTIQMGRHREPEVGEKEANKEEKAMAWQPEDLKFTAGWVHSRVKSWMDGHPCEIVEWVRPSLQRIF